MRHLQAVTIEERGSEIRAVFRGDGFLRGMVRSICGVLADVARGKVAVEHAAKLLETGDRGLLSHKAEACGLTLARVSYGESYGMIRVMVGCGMMSADPTSSRDSEPQYPKRVTLIP